MSPSSNDSGGSDLEERLRKASQRQAVRSVEAGPASGDSGIGIAARSGVEFVAAVVIAAGIGFVLDRWLHTSPIATLVMLFLGFGAGLLNLYRTLNRIPVGAIGKNQGPKSPDADDEDTDG